MRNSLLHDARSDSTSQSQCDFDEWSTEDDESNVHHFDANIHQRQDSRQDADEVSRMSPDDFANLHSMAKRARTPREEIGENYTKSYRSQGNRAPSSADDEDYRSVEDDMISVASTVHQARKRRQMNRKKNRSQGGAAPREEPADNRPPSGAMLSRKLRITEANNMVNLRRIARRQAGAVPSSSNSSRDFSSDSSYSRMNSMVFDELDEGNFDGSFTFVQERENRKRGHREKPPAHRHTNAKAEKKRHTPKGVKPCAPERRPQSFRDQFLANMERLILERYHSPATFLSEILVPIIFVIISILLSVGLKTLSYDEYNSLDYADLSPVSVMFAPQQFFMCAQQNPPPSYFPDGTLKPVVTGLSPCGVGMFAEFSCDGDDEMIPVRGLCHKAGYSGKDIVGAYVTSVMGNVSYVPDFDTIVAYQWLARKTMDVNTLSKFSALAASGFASNDAMSAIVSSGALYITPRNNITESFVDYLNSSTDYFANVFGGVFDSVEDVNSYLIDSPNPTWAVIVVHEMSSTSFDVSVQVNKSAVPSKATRINSRYSGGFQTKYAEMYFASGFLSLQKSLYKFFIERVSDTQQYYSQLDVHIPYAMSMGGIPYKQNQMLYAAAILVAFLASLSFLYPVTILAKRIVVERELRLEEATLIMGMSQFPRVFSLLIFYFMQNMFTALIMTLLVKCTYQFQTDFFIVFLVFFLLALNSISLGIMFAAVFSSAKLVSLLTPLVYFLMSLPLFAVTQASGTVVAALSFLPPSCFVGLMNLLYTHEVSGGFRAEHLHDPLDDPQAWLLLVVFAADFIAYIIIGFYLELVFPKDCGTQKSPFFFITEPIRACRRTPTYAIDVRAKGPDGRNPHGVYEDEDPRQEMAVEICGLRKTYKRRGKEFVALNNLYLNFPDGGISVLLGHNGAGKSTTLNMITGMTQPDEGDCLVYGHSVRKELTQVRQIIGYCPQHNILWPDLTVREHLEFFGKIKGLRGPELEMAVQHMLTEVDLVEKVEYRSRDLSGGQKRKLSVAIAFVGDSRLVFLDEPTAGMDVAARRHTWELLLRMSANRSVLLTTHFMDEADLLGDRVAIMSHGRLECCGSSLFLKSRLGAGYSISLSLSSADFQWQVEQLIAKNIAQSELLESKGTEVMYLLPGTEVNQFAKLLAAIEQKGEHMGITSYVLSATTLEEVFLRVAMGNGVEPPARGDLRDKQNTETDDSLEEMAQMKLSNSHNEEFASVGVDVPKAELQRDAVWNSEMLTGGRLFLWMQFSAMMKKRFFVAKRDKRMIFFQIVCPAFCVLLAMLLNLVDYSNPSSIVLTDPYPVRTEVLTSQCESVFGSAPMSYSADVLTSAQDMVNTLDLNYYLIDTWFTHQRPGRYTSFSCNDKDLHKSLSDGGFLISPVIKPVVMLYNTSSAHEVPAAFMHFYSSLIKHVQPSSPVLRTSIDNLPPTRSESVMKNSMSAILMSCIILIPISFLPSNCVSFIVMEKECKSRHLQNLSGLRVSMYWLANFLFDFALYLLTMLVIIIIFLIFRRDEYIGSQTAGPLVVLMLIYGVCSVLVAYVCHFAFSKSASAQTTLLVLGFCTGFFCVLFTFIFNMVDITKDIGQALRWPFRLFPTYSVGEGIVHLSTLEQDKLQDPQLTAWSLKVVGWPCVYMAIEIPIFVLLILLLDNPQLNKRWGSRNYDPYGPVEAVSGEDTDVEDERVMVEEESDRLLKVREQDSLNLSSLSNGSNDGYLDDPGDQSMSDAVTVVHLRKVYPNHKKAVRDLSFSVVPGEVFGFLGTNGAGKTTTISILCQEQLPSSGQVFICGYDLVKESDAALRCIGYCPQFDATLGLLTVEEHLRVFAGIRGILKEQQEDVIHGLLSICDLEQYTHVLSCELSGGNRRKLSVALALIGGPQVLFLDEPSAGMDPIARRGLWTTIQGVGTRCSIVLTTHHLEEVEALADCVAIMVDGGLRCIGTKTHLKNKYGSGFEMGLRVRSKADRPQVEEFIARSFPGSKLNEYRNRRFIYALPKRTLLSHVFSLLQEHKDKLGIVDYSVSQTSIEQVFMRISEEAAQQ